MLHNSMKKAVLGILILKYPAQKVDESDKSLKRQEVYSTLK